MARESDIAEFIARIDAAAEACPAAYRLSGILALSDEEKAGTLGILASAFDYKATLERTGVGSHFKPMFEIDAHVYPAPLDQVPEHVKTVWIEAADRCRSPLAVARFNDLCWEGAWSDRAARARRAADGYLLQAASLAVPAEDDSERVTVVMATLEALNRALQIGVQLRDEALIARASTAVADAARQSLARSSREAGVVLGLIEALIDARQRPEDVDQLLVETKDRYAADRFIVSDVIQLQLRIAIADDVRSELRRELVSNVLAQADEHQGLVRMHHLERATGLARDLGLSDLAREATALLQAMKPEDLDLKAQRFSLDLPREAVDQYLDEFSKADDWPQALDLLVQTPPSGWVENNRQYEEALSQEAPLSRLLPRTLLGGDGLPRFTASTDDERAEAMLVHSEMMRAQINAPLLNEALIRIWDKWGPLSEDAMAEYFTSGPHVTPEMARGIARDFLRFFSGDIEGAAYCLTTRIEALVRALVLIIPLPIYRTQRVNSPGQYPGLGALIPHLQAEGFDESWARFIQGLLSNPMGMNFRNELLHGFITEPHGVTVALLLVAAVYLTRGVPLVPRDHADAKPSTPS